LTAGGHAVIIFERRTSRLAERRWKLDCSIASTPGIAPGLVPLLVFSGAGGPYPAQVTVARLNLG
jgi:hypothetical protein